MLLHPNLPLEWGVPAANVPGSIVSKTKRHGFPSGAQSDQIRCVPTLLIPPFSSCQQLRFNLPPQNTYADHAIFGDYYRVRQSGKKIAREKPVPTVDAARQRTECAPQVASASRAMRSRRTFLEHDMAQAPAARTRTMLDGSQPDWNFTVIREPYS